MGSKLRRRTLLRGLGGVALALPFLDAMKHRGAAQAPMRYVQLFTPLGFSPGQWYTPEAAQGFTLQDFAAPLRPHAAEMLIVRGLRGWSGADGHHSGVGAVFTGASSGSGYGPSLDQEIAGLIDHRPFRSLHLGCFTTSDTSNAGQTQTVFSGANRPVAAISDPRAVFTSLFGGGTATGGEAIAETHARQRSVLDLVRDDLRDAQVGLSAADRRRLSDHAESLRSIEVALDGGPRCGDVSVEEFTVALEEEEGARISALQARLLAMAIACDLTRVATMQWSHSVNGLKYRWLEERMPGIASKSHHGWTHSPSTGDWSEGLRYFREIERWYVEQVGMVLDELTRLEVAEETLVLWGTNEARGPHGPDEEGRQDRTYVMFGSLGGTYRTGRVVDVQVDGYRRPEERWDYSPALLLNIAQTFGYTGATFGDAGRNQAGPMPGLLT
ncbi:MAG: DUF1552 domain-containing protein [Myxococcota bacterium]|nr:DUF1552 domain-containing protein [Myxococcota bacterium]